MLNENTATIINTYGYICTEGFDVYSENVQCLNGIRSHPIVENCQAIMDQKFEELPKDLDEEQAMIEYCG